MTYAHGIPYRLTLTGCRESPHVLGWEPMCFAARLDTDHLVNTVLPGMKHCCMVFTADRAFRLVPPLFCKGLFLWLFQNNALFKYLRDNK